MLRRFLPNCVAAEPLIAELSGPQPGTSGSRSVGTSGSRSVAVEDAPGGPRPAYLTACGRGARSCGLNGRASQTFAVLSPLPVTIREPSGLNDAE